jgi:poly-gamma-glutamate biosynthesis protein PgsC/CapC
MVTEALLIGLVLGFLFYELVGISPGGVIAPGYFALYVDQPQKLITTALLALIVGLVVGLMSQWTILYGKRRLLFALLLGFCAKLAVERWIQPLPAVTFDLQSIGYIIPGLVANEISRQKAIPTLASLGIVTVCVYLVLLLYR